jgi:TM2 domain-containing membrane protein YozV
MKTNRALYLILSIVFLWTGFHIFTSETNYISLWFGALVTGAGAILLGVVLSGNIKYGD